MTGYTYPSVLQVIGKEGWSIDNNGYAKVISQTIETQFGTEIVWHIEMDVGSIEM